MNKKVNYKKCVNNRCMCLYAFVCMCVLSNVIGSEKKSLRLKEKK